MEHRRGERISISLPVGTTDPVTSHCRGGRLMNLSVDGALIRGSVDAHVGARVAVSIGVPFNAAALAPSIDAYVVRKSGPTFAIQWANFAPAQILDLVREFHSHALQQLIPSSSPSPGKACPEFAESASLLFEWDNRDFSKACVRR